MQGFARPTLLLGLVSALALSGCGYSYQPSRAANFQLDREAEIDDDDIRKAFEARPQMPETSMRVSYYTFDPEIATDLEKTLSQIPGVASVYRIPPLLVTGERRLSEGDFYGYREPREVSVKKLRLLAARANTDVLLIVDHGYRNPGANPLAALNVLLVPILFVPFLDTSVKGYAEAFVIDVRNGYLYGHVVEEDQRGSSYATIYDKSAGTHAKEQWWELRKGLQNDLVKLVEDERARKASSTPKPKESAPAQPLDAAPPAPPPDR